MKTRPRVKILFSGIKGKGVKKSFFQEKSAQNTWTLWGELVFQVLICDENLCLMIKLYKQIMATKKIGDKLQIFMQ